MSDRNKVDIISPGLLGEGSTVTKRFVERQTCLAFEEEPGLATRLMERICERKNLNDAYKRVKSNKGAAGIDGKTVKDLRPYLEEHKEELISSLLEGSYTPEAIRGVEIPKADGGKRQLGIPTVVDRVVQQAIAQVLGTLYDEGFSESSYGFRPTRSAH